MNGKSKAALIFTAFVAVIISVYSIVAQKSLAPEVAITTLQGQKIALSDLRGKVVLVNFWATSCTTCVKEMPALIATHNRYAATGYETVAIAMDYDTPAYIETYAKKVGMPFKITHDVQGTAAAAFGGIRLTPTTFLIDKHGYIVQRYLGEPDFAKLDQLIQTLIAAPA